MEIDKTQKKVLLMGGTYSSTSPEMGHELYSQDRRRNPSILDHHPNAPGSGEGDSILLNLRTKDSLRENTDPLYLSISFLQR